METDGALNAIELAADGRLFALVDDSVLRSDDSGARWSQVVADGVDCLLLDEAGGQIILALADGSLRRQAL